MPKEFLKKFSDDLRRNDRLVVRHVKALKGVDSKKFSAKNHVSSGSHHSAHEVGHGCPLQVCDRKREKKRAGYGVELLQIRKKIDWTRSATGKTPPWSPGRWRPRDFTTLGIPTKWYVSSAMWASRSGTLATTLSESISAGTPGADL